MYPPVVARVNVACNVLIFDIADVVSFRGARYHGGSHPELLLSLNCVFFNVIVFQAPSDFALFPLVIRMTRRTLGLEVSNGR